MSALRGKLSFWEAPKSSLPSKEKRKRSFGGDELLDKKIDYFESLKGEEDTLPEPLRRRVMARWAALKAEQEAAEAAKGSTSRCKAVVTEETVETVKHQAQTEECATACEEEEEGEGAGMGGNEHTLSLEYETEAVDPLGVEKDYIEDGAVVGDLVIHTRRLSQAGVASNEDNAANDVASTPAPRQTTSPNTLLRSENIELRKKIDCRRQKMDDLKKKLAKLETKNQLIKKKTAMEERIKELRLQQQAKREAELRTDNEQLKAAIGAKEKEIIEAASTVDQVRAELQGLVDRMQQQLIEEQESHRKNIDELLTRYEPRLVSLEMQNACLEKEWQSTSKELRKREEEALRTAKELDELRKQLAGATEKARNEENLCLKCGGRFLLASEPKKKKAKTSKQATIETSTQTRESIGKSPLTVASSCDSLNLSRRRRRRSKGKENSEAAAARLSGAGSGSSTATPTSSTTTSAATSKNGSPCLSPIAVRRARSSTTPAKELSTTTATTTASKKKSSAKASPAPSPSPAPKKERRTTATASRVSQLARSTSSTKLGVATASSGSVAVGRSPSKAAEIARKKKDRASYNFSSGTSRFEGVTDPIRFDRADS